MALVHGQSTAMQGTPAYVMQKIMNICPTCRGTQTIQIREHVKPECANFKKNGTGVGCMIGECFAKVDKYCPNCESIKLIFQELEDFLEKMQRLNCKTCNGTGEVGAKGIYLDCPDC